MRGLDDDKKNSKLLTSASSSFWGTLHEKSHFRRIQECPDASFGTRPNAATPHAFEAHRLLERLSCDPGIVAIMTSRKLTVNTLGEMDPIEDVLMHKTRQQSGGAACLLGYNTNHGLRIDIKLRTEDLSSFRPYRELVATLIHELSHNWVEEHDLLFWTNYGQMRIEYLWEHACLMMGGMFVNGKRTATLAEVEDMIRMSPSSSSSYLRGRINNGNQSARRRQEEGTSNNNFEDDDDYQIMDNICQSVCQELERQMTAQHHIPVSSISPGLLTFGNELIVESRKKRYQKSGGGIDDASNDRMRGRKLGGGGEVERISNFPVPTNVTAEAVVTTTTTMTARDRALAAAEKRRRAADCSSSTHGTNSNDQVE